MEKNINEFKQEILKKAEPYLIQGWNLRTIHRQLEAEYQNEGKEMISWWSFYPLVKHLKSVMQAQGKIGADADGANLSDKSDGADSAGTEEPSEPAEEPEEEQDEEPEAEDDGGEYVRTLEDMLRLYRRRTEADVDAVCDRLLPGLLAEEE